MATVRYGIIGIGKMGSIHAIKLKYKLVRGAVLTAVCDIDKKRRDWAESKLKGVKVYSDYRDMLASKKMDVVVIATPHYLHPVIAKEALEAGYHTLTEKPAGVYTAAVRQMNEVAAAHPKQKFGIMYNQRTNPLYRAAKDIVDSGRLGELKRINWIITNWYRPQAYYDQGGWRGTWGGEGGGALINQCPHQLDLFQWLGGMPCKVRGYAKVGHHRNINVENDVTAYFEYPNGATGVFITSTHDFPGTNRLEIDGDKGQIVIEKNRLTFHELEIGETEFNATNKKFMPKIPKKTYGKRITLLGQLKMAILGQHTAILQNFTNSILYNEKLIAPGYDGIRGLSISNAIHLSEWTKSEVPIPPNEEQFKEELLKRIEEEKQANLEKKAKEAPAPKSNGLPEGAPQQPAPQPVPAPVVAAATAPVAEPQAEQPVAEPVQEAAPAVEEVVEEAPAAEPVEEAVEATEEPVEEVQEVAEEPVEEVTEEVPAEEVSEAPTEGEVSDEE